MSSQKKPIEVLLACRQSVFDTQDLRALWTMKNDATLRVQISYYVKTGRLLRLRRGIYATTRTYNPLELAQKLANPSYVSLETALRMHGIIHQQDEMITCIGPYSRTMTVDGRRYEYHRMDLMLLSCPIGIERKKSVWVAGPERALCDALYLDYNPDVSRYSQWDGVILRALETEFSLPRITHGLRTRRLLP